MTVKKIAILANSSKPKINEVLKEMEVFFAKKNIEVFVYYLDSNEKDLDLKICEVDLVVSLGGDGTVLSCASILGDKKTPIMAVNMGTFGYMTEIALSEYKDVFEDYVFEREGVSQRMRLKAKVVRNKKTVFQNTALNDITVTSDGRAKMAKITLSINDIFAANLRSDGLIVATPSGSTAYNLSAGGPILDAKLNSIIVNPICPFAMSVRPLVIGDNSKVSIQVPEQKTNLVLTCDGHQVFSLKTGDEVELCKNEIGTYFVENSRRKFIEILRDKLGWAGGFNA